MKNYSVYCHVTPSGRKYVGISCDPLKRWNEGRGYSKNYIFSRAIKKYGWDNIEHIILYHGLTLENAKEIEANLISKWQLTNKEYGYNLTDIINGISIETKQRMSAAQKGNKNSKGRVLSPETRLKISNSLKEYYSIEKNRKHLYRPHSKETIEKLKNRKFSKETRMKMSCNHYDCSGINNPSSRPIRQLSLNNNLIKEFNYATLAAKEYNIDLSSIIKCCRGKMKSAGGYRWEYK